MDPNLKLDALLELWCGGASNLGWPIHKHVQFHLYFNFFSSFGLTTLPAALEKSMQEQKHQNAWLTLEQGTLTFGSSACTIFYKKCFHEHKNEILYKKMRFG